MIELVFDLLSLDLVAVPVQDGNEKSRRAVEKYAEANGDQYDGIIRNPTVRPTGEIIDHHRYTIPKEQYQETEVGQTVPILRVLNDRQKLFLTSFQCGKCLPVSLIQRRTD